MISDLCLFCLIVFSYSCFIVYLFVFKCILLYRWCNLIQALCLCCIFHHLLFCTLYMFFVVFYDGNKLELELELEKHVTTTTWSFETVSFADDTTLLYSHLDISSKSN